MYLVKSKRLINHRLTLIKDSEDKESGVETGGVWLLRRKRRGNGYISKNNNLPFVYH